MPTLREQRQHPGSSEGEARGPSVAVVVPVHNAEAGISALLTALEAQSVGREAFEILIVDDCSSDGTIDVVARSGIATPIRSPSRGGSAGARNRGLQVAAAQVVAFTDADCVPAPDWVERGLSAMTEDVDLLVGAVEMPLGPAPSPSALIDCARNLDQEQYARDGHGATANLWVRASIFRTVGLFNPNLVSGADTELCRRAVAAGARVRYGKELKVAHEPRRTARALARKCFRLGYGAAQHRRHSVDPMLRNRPRYWLHPGSYVPRRAIQGIDRLERQGHRFDRRRMLVLQATQHLCVRLPYALGNLAGTIAEAARRGGSRPIPALNAGEGSRRWPNG